MPLSEIIEILNARFGTNFTKVDQLFFDQVTQSAKADEDIIEKAGANAFDNFALAVNDRLLDLVIDRMDKRGDHVEADERTGDPAAGVPGDGAEDL